jgi:hypothetical protein
LVKNSKPQGRNDPAASYFLAPEQIVVMDLGTIANVATAMTVLVGVAFGLVEMRRATRSRRAPAFSAVQAFMTPEWMSSSTIVHSIPRGTTAEQLENDPRMLEACLKIATIMEGIGYSVYARIVPLSVAADLIGGTAQIAWQNIRPFVELERMRAGTQKSWEWFLEQLERHSVTKTNLKMGAQTVYRDWQP